MIDAVLMLRGDLSVIVSRNANCISGVNTNLFCGGRTMEGRKPRARPEALQRRRGVSVTSGPSPVLKFFEILQANPCFLASFVYANIVRLNFERTKDALAPVLATDTLHTSLVTTFIIGNTDHGVHSVQGRLL